MKSLFRAGAAFLVLSLAACGGSGGNNSASLAPANGPIANVAAPNGADWTETVSQTQYGFLMGNPNAPVKLVEYASITCPHCAEFTTDGGAEGIQSYVRSGRVSWEYRPFMLQFPTDPGLFALLRCNGAGTFFALTEQLYAEQRTWSSRGQVWLEANRAAFQAMSDQAKATTLVRETGVDAFFRQRGMTQPQIEQCLANVANIQRVAADTQHAVEADNPPGTPTFYINGRIQEGVGLWSGLEPKLREAVGG